ncbi:hypothetical protein [Streptomyces sp. NPDC015131]|uniref:hypothetical protein n=1 Tax=Streptomyces sp. NPDC015131 TaxID=3364941 RepID=UPI0036FAD9B1
MFTRPAPAASPIYDQLVEEHGDVLGDARKLAEITHQQAERLLAPAHHPDEAPGRPE